MLNPDCIHPAVQKLLKNPEIIGRAAGFRDLTEMHGAWIREMVFGQGDYTLQAHRGSYKSSCSQQLGFQGKI